MRLNLSDIESLEQYFADHLDSVIFPVLAEQYIYYGDLSRAKKVCEVGLSNYPDNQDGLFVYGRVALAENRLRDAEKLLERVVAINPGHLNALLLLAEVLRELQGSDRKITEIYTQVLQLDSANARAIEWMEARPSHVKKKPQPQQKLKNKKHTTIKKVKKIEPDVEQDMEASLPLGSQVATFTLVEVLKRQGLFNQALEALRILRKREGVSREIVDKESEEIKKKIKAQGGKSGESHRKKS